MEIFLLQRIGYGSAFNNLYITPTTVKKEYKNEYGKVKLEKEILFYRYLIERSIPFARPKIYEFTPTSYTMQNMTGYVSLYTVFSTFTPQKKRVLLERVYRELDMLHQSEHVNISREKLEECLQIETHTKLLERVQCINELLAQYSHVQKVNNIVLKSFDTILSLISEHVQKYLSTIDTYRLCLIHGDCQFNNVLYNPSSGDIVFIDPRGYFGSVGLFGIPEYDSAKVLFALSGYDVFDNMDVSQLDISGDTVSIPNLFQIDDDQLFKQGDIVSVLAISVWLGNAHCFKHNPPKALFSYFYAMYLASRYL
jgi:hypothetical protein